MSGANSCRSCDLKDEVSSVTVMTDTSSIAEEVFLSINRKAIFCSSDYKGVILMRRLFSSESVTEGHPDKICDQISDAILDEILKMDPNGRVACETTVTTGMVYIMGEITTSANVNFPKVARDVIRDIGYTNTITGFDADSCAVITSIDEQSADIAMGVDRAMEYKTGELDDQIEAIGAGDQGIIFGFACNETPELMPAPVIFAHKLVQKLARVRKDGTISYLRPDGKSQVTVEYNDEGKIERIDTVLISTQHDDNIELEQIRKDLIEKVIRPTLPAELLDDRTRFLINPTGRFVIGGPQGDSGLTGRKIIVDTYGGYARHGGGAFSGKDPTKVDRSAAYAARYVAKNIVAAGLADKCEIQLAYAIGVARPVSIMIDTFGTGRIPENELVKKVEENFDLRPAGIIRMLDLRRPIYRQVAAYGHFGRTDIDVPWEKTDKAEALKK